MGDGLLFSVFSSQAIRGQWAPTFCFGFWCGVTVDFAPLGVHDCNVIAAAKLLAIMATNNMAKVGLVHCLFSACFFIFRENTAMITTSAAISVVANMAITV